jgi:hypothetical protein
MRVTETRRRGLEQRRKSEDARTQRPQPKPPWPDGPGAPVDRDFQEACLNGTAFAALVEANPNVALEVLLAVCIEEPQHDDYMGPSALENYGLAYWHAGEPPMYFRGPFLRFLRAAPEQGISFVLRLVNFATRRCVGGDFGVTLEVDGKSKLWRGDNRVFRWLTTGL